MSAAELTVVPPPRRGCPPGARKCTRCLRRRNPELITITIDGPVCINTEACVGRARATTPDMHARFEAIDARLTLLRELLAGSREALRQAEAHVDLLESMLAGESP